MSRTLLPFAVLLVGVGIASTAAVLIRWAQADGMPSLTIAAGRLALAALILAPLAWARVGDELVRLPRRAVVLGMASGGLLALHFASWISSLAFTSVANSVALVSTSPLWVGLASWLLLRERLGRGTLAGVVLTIVGSLAIAFSDTLGDSGVRAANPLLGNALAVVGAVTVSGYLLIGRDLRRHLSLLAYIWLVYTTAAAVLVVLVVLSGQPVWGFSPLTYGWLLALALGPQLLAHTSFNWALRYLSATFIAVSVLGEPIGSAVLAWFVLAERIDITTTAGQVQLVGFGLLLVGIFLASLSEQPASSDRPAPA